MNIALNFCYHQNLFILFIFFFFFRYYGWKVVRNTNTNKILEPLGLTVFMFDEEF
jgi:hypothetical protein